MGLGITFRKINAPKVLEKKLFVSFFCFQIPLAIPYFCGQKLTTFSKAWMRGIPGNLKLTCCCP